MLMALRIDSMQKQDGQCKQRNGNPKKEPKRNARGEKHLTEMSNAFDGLISTLDTAEERLSKLENVSIESSKTKKQRE